MFPVYSRYFILFLISWYVCVLKMDLFNWMQYLRWQRKTTDPLEFDLQTWVLMTKFEWSTKSVHSLNQWTIMFPVKVVIAFWELTAFKWNTTILPIKMSLVILFSSEAHKFLIPTTHMKVKGENMFHKAVLGLSRFRQVHFPLHTQ